jgi:putative tricarboxylic transport membrane protein
MDAFSQLMNGFAIALTWKNLMWCLVGTTLGTAIGVLPGLGPALTIALLLPITFKVDPTAAFILFAGIYYGAMYGGSTTSILLNTPGESATIVTALEARRLRPQPSGHSWQAQSERSGSPFWRRWLLSSR